MSIYTRKKTTSTVENLINWAELSKLLTGGGDRIRKNRIPKVHSNNVNDLLRYIQAWQEGKKLFTEQNLVNSLQEIDLKTILCTKMGIKP